MAGFGTGWGNGAQLFWRPPAAGESLLVPLTPGLVGTYDLVLHYTVAPDYGTFSVMVNARLAADEVPGFGTRVEPRSVSLGRHELEGPETQFLFIVEGKDPRSTGYLLGLDRVELTPVPGIDVAASPPGIPPIAPAPGAPPPAGAPPGVPVPPTTGRWVDAAVTTQGATYLFQGSSYLRFHAARLDPGYPRPLSGGGWQGLPGDFLDGIDAALYAADVAKTYLFKGNQYLRLTGVAVDPGYPRALPGGWQGLPAEFQGGIDAALYQGGHVYLFRGRRYVRFTGARLDPGYPVDLPGGWELPAGFGQVDAAVSLGDKNYFFSGGDYVRLTGTRVDAGYPQPLPGGWAGLPPPQALGSVRGSAGRTLGPPDRRSGGFLRSRHRAPRLRGHRHVLFRELCCRIAVPQLDRCRRAG